MSQNRPGIPKGMRDFNPGQVRKRQYIIQIIKEVFELFSFQPIETPSMENLATLTGKYGDEGDRLLFRVLNSGDFLSKADQEALDEKNSGKLVSSIAKKGLRYDLTIPFARYVAMNRNDITFPFKRYQIQPVWRADRPQKGRYQEFWQCDVDVIGSNDRIYEAELLQIYHKVFEKLNIPVTIKVNNRKILEGLAAVLDVKDKLSAFTVILDKLDKSGMEKMLGEMQAIGIRPQNLETLNQLISQPITDFSQIENTVGQTNIGQKGIEELKGVFSYFEDLNSFNIEFDLTLARGLDYYTGIIMEVKADDSGFGSVGGGGRYDDLTGVFGLPDVSGVGISFGLDRIYDVMEAGNMFPDMIHKGSQILFVNFGGESEKTAFKHLSLLRNESINGEIYPNAAKMKKQLKFADALHIPYVAIIGPEELESGTIALKNMESGEQLKVDYKDLSEILQKG